MNNKQQPQPEALRSAGYVFSDGRLVDLCYVPREGRTYFVVGDHQGHEDADHVRLTGNTTLVPMSPSNNLILHRAIVLPERLDVCGTPEELVREIEAFMDRYLALSPSFRRVASTYILLSWVYDRFNELPYLRFRGDFGTGKSRALTIIGSLLYKGFFASGASTVSPIFHILHAFRGSLILDEADFRFSDEKAEMSKILNNGNMRGFPVLRQTMNIKKEFDPKAFQVFGPKIIAARQSFDDLALESRFLTTDMGYGKVPPHIPDRMPEHWDIDARTLRNQLLGYRFAYRHTIAVDGDYRDPARSARTNQIIGPLLAVAPTQLHYAAIIEYAAELESDVKADRSVTLDAALVEATMALAATTEGSIPVSAITRAFAASVAGDTDRAITPRYTGFLLRRHLRLRTVRISGSYVVPDSERSKIEALAHRYGID